MRFLLCGRRLPVFCAYGYTLSFVVAAVWRPIVLPLFTVSWREHMDEFLPTAHGTPWNRRHFLGAAAAAGAAGAAGLLPLAVHSQPRKITLAWSQASFCQVPVPIALERGLFEKNGLQVEVLNWGGSADQLLEALATGKAEVGWA
jgi:hypothetical protein